MDVRPVSLSGRRGVRPWGWTDRSRGLSGRVPALPPPLACGPVLAGGTPALPPAMRSGGGRPPAALRAPWGGGWLWECRMGFLGRKVGLVGVLWYCTKRGCCWRYCFQTPNLFATRPGASPNTKPPKPLPAPATVADDVKSLCSFFRRIKGHAWYCP